MSWALLSWLGLAYSYVAKQNKKPTTNRHN
jgi:hypothetical protein